MERIRDAVAGPTPRRGLRSSMLCFGKTSSGMVVGLELEVEFFLSLMVGRDFKAVEVHLKTNFSWLDFIIPMSAGRGRPCLLDSC